MVTTRGDATMASELFAEAPLASADDDDDDNDDADVSLAKGHPPVMGSDLNSNRLPRVSATRSATSPKSATCSAAIGACRGTNGDHSSNCGPPRVRSAVRRLINGNCNPDGSPELADDDDDAYQGNGEGTCGCGEVCEKCDAMDAVAAAIAAAEGSGDNGGGVGSGDEMCLEFGESAFGSFSASLEDLVSSFDAKITKCLRDYQQTTDQLAPVQVRSQEEIMSTDQVWWTLTGNYGNIMPIDWSKSYARKMQLDALNINEQYNDCQTLRHSVDSSDEEDVDRDLDLHSLILTSLTTSDPPQAPVQSADEVIRQIEDIMAESCSSDDGIASGETTPVNSPTSADDRSSPDGASSAGGGLGGATQSSSEGAAESDAAGCRPLRAQIAGLIRSDRLRGLSAAELVEVHSALEREVQLLSETLVAQLAQRDELDFEKETKNTFISLLLTVQNRRRQFTIDRKRGRGHTIINGEPKYLTTVIPYNPAVGSRVSVVELQILIKILHAINDDSPTVPTLLTDYILKVLCPT